MTKVGFFESVYNKNKKGTPFLVSALLTLTSGVALAADLTVVDKEGVTYLKVDAPQGSSLDLKVIANLSSANSETLTLKRDGESAGTEKTLSISDREVMFDNVKVGSYTLTSSSALLKVEEVSVVPENIAKSEEGTKDLEKAGYAVGGVALIGGIVGASSSDSLLGSSSSSDGNVAREGSLGSDNSGSTDSVGSSNEPRSNEPRVAPSFDPNRPDVTTTPVPAPSTVAAGSRPGAQPTQTPVPGVNPTIAPAPSPVQPMTPS